MSMAEPSIHQTKIASKNQSEFYRHVILPSQTYRDKHQRRASEAKKAAATYEKQTPLKKSETEKYRNDLQRQLCIDMLRQGYHHSFRELCAILSWQKEDRQRLGTEHPSHGRLLLDAEPDKLRFLCVYLNKAEDAERRRRYSNMYKSYLELASFFLKSDDRWLSDQFYEKCLSVAQTYAQLDQQLAAEAYLNVGLAYERQGDLMKALDHFERYRQLGDEYYELKTNANLQLTRLFMKLADRTTDKEALEYTLKASEAAAKSDDRKVENETSYKLGLIYLEHNDIEPAIRCLRRYYDYCQYVNDGEGFGHASEALAICYQKTSNIDKSSEYLNKYLEKVSNGEGNIQYARACSTLALIETSLGRYRSAIDSSTKAYSISLSTCHSDCDRNRVLYGIANGLELRSYFAEQIDQMNTRELAQWKSIQFKLYSNHQKI